MPDSSLSVGIVVGAALGSTFGSTFQTAEQRSKKLGDALKKVRLNTRLTGDVIQYKEALDQLKRKQAQAGTSSQKFAGEIAQVERRYQTAAQKAKKYGLQIGDAARLHRQFSRTAREAEQSLERLQRRQARQQKRQALRSRALPLLGAAYAAASPIKAAIQFESVMADVRKVVNFDSPGQFKAMGKDILRLSTVIPMAASGIGDIVAAAGQAGIARHELLRFAEDAAKMGVAFDMSGEQAGSAMTGMRTIFKLNQDQVVGLGDAYNHLSNNMDATARDMINIAERTGSTGQLMGLSGQQVGALGATFLALKSPPEVAATGINAMLQKLQTASQQGPKFQDALAGIGMSAEGLKQAIKQDAQGALLDFLEAVKSSDDVAGTLSNLFGIQYSDDIAKLLGSLDLYRKALGLVADETRYAGSMQKEYEERAKTTENELQLLRNQFTRLGVNLGSTVLPAIRWLGSGLGWVAGGVADLADRFPGATKAVVGLTIGFVGLVASVWVAHFASTLLGDAWDTAKGAAKGLAKAIGWTRGRLVAFNATALLTAARTKALAIGGAIKSFGSSLIGLASRAIPGAVIGLKTLAASMWALVANPVGAIIAGIALGIAAAGMLIYKYWEPIKAFFGGLWQGFMEGLQPLLGALGQLWTTLVEAVRPALEPLESIWSELGGALSWVGDVIGSVVDWFGSLLTPVSAVSEETRGAAQAGLWLGKILGTLVVGTIKLLLGHFKIWDKLMTVVGQAIFGLAKAAWNLGGALIEGIGSAWRSVMGWLEGFSLYDVGTAILTTLGEGILGAGGWLLGQVQSVFGKVRDLLPFSDAKAGPFSALTASGQSILSTLGQGVRQAGPQALQRPLTRALTTATAGLALALPIAAETPEPADPVAAQSLPISSLTRQHAPAVAAQPTGQTIIHNYYNRIEIHQLPGEDASALAERRDQLRRRGVSHDGF